MVQIKAEKKYDTRGIRLTDCCGAYSTYHDSDLICKKCYNLVAHGAGDGTERIQPLKYTIEKIKGKYYIGYWKDDACCGIADECDTLHEAQPVLARLKRESL